MHACMLMHILSIRACVLQDMMRPECIHDLIILGAASGQQQQTIVLYSLRDKSPFGKPWDGDLHWNAHSRQPRHTDGDAHTGSATRRRVHM